MTGTEHRAVLAASTALMNGQKRTESRFKETHAARLTKCCSEHAQAPSAAKERLETGFTKEESNVLGWVGG